MNNLRSMVALAAVALMSMAALGQTSVVVRAHAMLMGAKSAEGQDGANPAARVVLRDIAKLSGTEADRLGDVEILADANKLAMGGAGWIEISMSDVRAALQTAGVNWGRVQLSGSTCTLRLGAVVVKEKETKKVGGMAKGEKTPQRVEMEGDVTIRMLVARRVASLLNVENDQLRLAFDEGDEELLDQAVGKRRVDLQPAAMANSAKLPMVVNVYEGERVTISRTIGTTPLMRKSVVVASGAIERGATLTQDQYEVSEQWMSPGAKGSVDPERLGGGGAVAGLRIAAGQVITAGDLTSPMVCKRGDIVYVHVLSGSFTIKAKARAMGTARDGEMVQLKLEGSDRVFNARMSGRGRAVMVVDDLPEIEEKTKKVAKAGVK